MKHISEGSSGGIGSKVKSHLKASVAFQSDDSNIINLSLFKALILKTDRLHMLRLRYFITSGNTALLKNYFFFLWAVWPRSSPFGHTFYCCSSILTDLPSLVLVVVVCLLLCFWWEASHTLFKLISHFQQYQSSARHVPSRTDS